MENKSKEHCINKKLKPTHERKLRVLSFMLHSFGGMLINGQYLDGSILQNNYHLNATNL